MFEKLFIGLSSAVNTSAHDLLIASIMDAIINFSNLYLTI